MPWPQAMWQAAFSSKSVSRKTTPVLPDARVAVDERDLAEEARALVGRHLLAHGVRAGLGAHLDDLARLEAQLEAADDRAAERERERRAHGALGAPPVGRREDLLGRHVDEVRDAVDRLLGAGEPAVRLASSPTGRSVPGPRKRIASNRRSSSERGALAQALDVLLPGGDRIGLVEPRRGDDRVPEPLDVRLAEDGLRPAFVRVADDRPLDQPSVLGVEELLRREARARALGAPLVEIGEELGLGLARDRDRRAAASSIM